MDTQERITYLKSIDLFSAFTDSELVKFAEKISEQEYASGEIVFREDEPGEEMFILLKGTLKVFKGSRVITVIKPVDYVGEMAIIEDKPRSATVQADKKSLLMKISAEQFQDVVRQPKSHLAMMRALSMRIRRDTEMIAQEFEKANILIHDMKNILTPFMFLNAIKRNSKDEGLSRKISFMQSARDNLFTLMDEALANAKRLYRPVQMSNDSLAHLVFEMVESDFKTHPEISDKKIDIQINTTLPDFPFCRLEIKRVLVNLVLNAAQASRKGDVVTISIDREEDTAKVKVKDNGFGIRSDLGDKIFEPYFTTKPDKGTGFGLASCKQVIEKSHKGKIFYKSKPGEGTEFTFLLPLTIR